jgi:hypothetical protein
MTARERCSLSGRSPERVEGNGFSRQPRALMPDDSGKQQISTQTPRVGEDAGA